jgi:putative ATP-dependent endonuclease of OLD family
MYLSSITIENFRIFGQGSDALVLPVRRGLTALVGENDSGKTAIIDALRYALGTTDQEWHRLEDADFHGEGASREIKIVCKFEDLRNTDKRAFVEFLTYSDKPGADPVLYVNWTAKDAGEVRKGRPYRQVEVHSGKDGNGPSIPPEVRELLCATYLRPLRDAEQALSAGRGSRLSQVLLHTDQIKVAGVRFDREADIDPKTLNVLGIGDLANALLEKQQGVVSARDEIDKHLKTLSLTGEGIKSSISVSGATASDDVRLRHLLEKLDLTLGGTGKLGLGSNNLLFIACELLLLAQEDAGNKLLLIEEPEAHLHTQRQLRLMKSIQEQAEEKGIQIIVTTHSPNLASAIELNNMVMIRNGDAFSMAEDQTELEPSDYRFLQRFLDATKANLFFARGVMIVEGDAENILLPTLANLIGRDFTEHGVSIVNVGGVGLRRYARIFQRKNVKDEEQDRQLSIRVACVTDMDVMPDCGGKITGMSLPTKTGLGEENLSKRRDTLRKKASGQCVQTFVSDEWTLEYDLAFSGLAEDIYVAAHLAKKDEALNRTKLDSETKAAQAGFECIEEEARKAVAGGSANGCSYGEVLAAKVYAQFTKGTKASKAVAAQYLAERLRNRIINNELTADKLRVAIPKYLTEAIDYVTGSKDAPGWPTDKARGTDE